jgi:hypothetical protein
VNESNAFKCAWREESLSRYLALSSTAFPPLEIIVDNIILEHELKSTHKS